MLFLLIWRHCTRGVTESELYLQLTQIDFTIDDCQNA